MRSTIFKAISLLSFLAVSSPAFTTVMAQNYAPPGYVYRGNQDITYTIPRNYRGQSQFQTRGVWNNQGQISGPYFGQEHNTLWGTLGGAVLGNGIGYLTGGNRTAWTLGGTALGFLWGKTKDRSDDFQYYYHPATTRTNRSIYTSEEGKTYSIAPSSSQNVYNAYSRSESNVIME